MLFMWFYDRSSAIYLNTNSKNVEGKCWPGVGESKMCGNYRGSILDLDKQKQKKERNRRKKEPKERKKERDRWKKESQSNKERKMQARKKERNREKREKKKVWHEEKTMYEKQVLSKVGDFSQGWLQGCLFNNYYTQVLGTALLHSLDCSI